MSQLMTRTRSERDADDQEVSLETLEGRRNDVEQEMFKMSGLLSERLHQAEQQVGELHVALHNCVCLSGRTPIEVKTQTVVRLLGETFDQIDRDDLLEAGERVAGLKALIDHFEAAILQRLRLMPTAVGSSPDTA